MVRKIKIAVSKGFAIRARSKEGKRVVAGTANSHRWDWNNISRLRDLRTFSPSQHACSEMTFLVGSLMSATAGEDPHLC